MTRFAIRTVPGHRRLRSASNRAPRRHLRRPSHACNTSHLYVREHETRHEQSYRLLRNSIQSSRPNTIWATTATTSGAFEDQNRYAFNRSSDLKIRELTLDAFVGGDTTELIHSAVLHATDICGEFSDVKQRRSCDDDLQRRGPDTIIFAMLPLCVAMIAAGHAVCHPTGYYNDT